MQSVVALGNSALSTNPYLVWLCGYCKQLQRTMVMYEIKIQRCSVCCIVVCRGCRVGCPSPSCHAIMCLRHIDQYNGFCSPICKRNAVGMWKELATYVTPDSSDSSDSE